MKYLQNLENICIQNNLEFPKITAISIFDPNIFINKTWNNSTIITNRPDGIIIAGYEIEGNNEIQQIEHKWNIYYALSKFLSSNENKINRHSIIDTNKWIMNKTKLEGWNVYDLKNMLFYEIFIVDEISNEWIEKSFEEELKLNSNINIDEFNLNTLSWNTF
jgi:hypothetical protein